MSADASAFSCLPLAVRDSLLQQAFQQLDQRHLFGVAPRVCRLWHQLSLSIITSLDVKINTREAAEQLSLWMHKHGAAGLKTLQLLLDETVCRTPAGGSVLQSLGAAMQLRSLSILTNVSIAELDVLDVPLPPLTNLTSLSINTCSLIPTVVSSILSLSSLNSLSLNISFINEDGADSRDSGISLLEQMAARLVGLTSLDLDVSSASTEGLAHLQALPQLKRLSVLPISLCSSKLRFLNGLPVIAIRIHTMTGALSGISSWLHSAASSLEHLGLLNFSEDPTAPAHFLPFYKAVHLESLELLKIKPDLTQLAALTQLTSLSLRECDMHDTDVCTLSALTGLQSLDLGDNPGIAGAHGSMEVLARSMPQLCSLDLFETAAQDAAQRAFEGRRLVFYGNSDSEA